MNGFIPSSRLKNIFYGDIFRLNEKGCLVFGYGKSKAFKNVIQDEKDIISLDMACITSDLHNIYGHMEMEIIPSNAEDPIKSRIKLEYFVRMLDEKETNSIFNNRKIEIKTISINDFIRVSEFNITFQVLMGMPTENSNKLNDFKEIIGDKEPICILVPWCNTIEEKSELIKQYIK